MRLERSFATFLISILLVGPVAGQSVHYEVQPIDLVPDAFSTVATGMNDLGHVVGWSQFFDGSPSLQPWIWTAEDGTTLLPIPPGLSIARAIDINNTGMIAGDGGFDSGQAWRLEDGEYTLLGFLPDTFVSTASAINESGEIAGTSRNPSIIFPPEAFLDVPGEGMEQVFEGAWATFLNDVGQIVGYTSSPVLGESNKAWRFTPGVGAELLGPLGSKPLNFATSVNNAGDVVGWASHDNGNQDVPFLFTDGGGMQEIGDFGGDAFATDINDAQQVIGFWDLSGGNRPWIWTAADGVTFLPDVIDQNLNVNLLDAIRINNAGQILGRVFDNDIASFVPVVLTPDLGVWTDLGFGLAGADGEPVLTGQGTLMAEDPITLNLSGAAANVTAFVALGFDRLDLPFKDGVLVPVFLPPDGLLLIFPTDSNGELELSSLWPSGVPSATSFFAQIWILDPSGPRGFTASNALEAVSP